MTTRNYRAMCSKKGISYEALLRSSHELGRYRAYHPNASDIDYMLSLNDGESLEAFAVIKAKKLHNRWPDYVSEDGKLLPGFYELREKTRSKMTDGSGHD